MIKKVLVTGAGGFIGRALIKELADHDFEVIPVVRKNAGLKGEIRIDFCNRDFYNLIYALPKVDAIVHLGAKIGWDGARRSELFLPNVVATAALADWASSNGIYFVFASAAIVCGAKNPLISLSSVPNPDTDYGYSKFVAEEAIKMSEAKFLILRIAGVFGKDGPNHLGLNRAIAEALQGKVPVVNGDGKLKRNYMYVKDLAALIVMCIEKEIQGTHLAASRSIISIGDMMESICRIILPGNKPEYREGISGQNQIVEPALVFPNEHSFEDAIKDIVIDAKNT
jgi:nucleoside-diphosphate-sugar epimerase